MEVITDPAFEAARCCPRCGKAATRVKERPRTAPRDVFTGDRQVVLDWRKTRWHCDTPGCEQGAFTEWLPAVKRRARLTSRLRTCLGEAVGDDLTPAAAAARRYGVRPHRRPRLRLHRLRRSSSFAGLDNGRNPVQAAGVDEFRRGAPADRTDPETGEVTRTRSEWLTHLVTWNSPAAPWAWPRAAPPPPRRTCSPGTPGRCGTWRWTCRPLTAARRPRRRDPGS